MIAPGFESHQCLAGMWKRWFSCHAGRQQVNRCHTRSESQGMCNITRTPLLSSNKAEPTLSQTFMCGDLSALKSQRCFPNFQNFPLVQLSPSPFLGSISMFRTFMHGHLCMVTFLHLEYGDANFLLIQFLNFPLVQLSPSPILGSVSILKHLCMDIYAW